MQKVASRGQAAPNRARSSSWIEGRTRVDERRKALMLWNARRGSKYWRRELRPGEGIAWFMVVLKE